MLRLVVLASLAALAGPACATVDDAPTEEELADLDHWANAADGKADLPSTFGEVAAWLRDVYTNRMSAIWRGQEYLASPAAALTRIGDRARGAGIDPTRALYPATVRRLDAGQIDHSELDIAMPGGGVIRLVGDPKGAGAFVDRAAFEAPIGPRLCLTHAELEVAIRAAYVPGVYGVDFVCHTVTERVMRALHIGTASFASKFRTYAAARWLWGPQLPSGNSQDPATWPESRSCPGT